MIQLTVSISTFVKPSIQFLMQSYCRSYWILGLLLCYGPGFKRICPHVDSVCVEDTLSHFLPVLSGVLKAALLVHCSSLFILMTFLLVVACHPISYLLMTPNVLTGYLLLLIV